MKFFNSLPTLTTTKNKNNNKNKNGTKQEKKPPTPAQPATTTKGAPSKPLKKVPTMNNNGNGNKT
jgi:hypothetical protein